MHIKQYIVLIAFAINSMQINCQEFLENSDNTTNIGNKLLFVESPRVHSCWWDNCSKTFNFLKKLRNHMYKRHGK